MEFTDSTNYSIVHNYEEMVRFSLPVKDSVKLIFADPDLCPVCSPSIGDNQFTDTVTFFSNSIINSEYSLPVKGDGITDINEDSKIHLNFKLFQNYPNPFNPTTVIKFNINSSSYVILNIYDVLGNIVKELVNDKLDIAQYEIKFDGTNLVSGVYYYRLITNSYSQTKKLLLMK